jgi:hypothetical protein
MRPLVENKPYFLEKYYFALSNSVGFCFHKLNNGYDLLVDGMVSCCQHQIQLTKFEGCIWELKPQTKVGWGKNTNYSHFENYPCNVTMFHGFFQC